MNNYCIWIYIKHVYALEVKNNLYVSIINKCTKLQIKKLKTSWMWHVPDMSNFSLTSSNVSSLYVNKPKIDIPNQSPPSHSTTKINIKKKHQNTLLVFIIDFSMLQSSGSNFGRLLDLLGKRCCMVLFKKSSQGFFSSLIFNDYQMKSKRFSFSLHFIMS